QKREDFPMARLLVAFIVCTMTFPVLAQQPPKSEPPPAAGPPRFEMTVNRRQMEEDIEIMRRLLAKPLIGQAGLLCMSCHQAATGAASTGSASSNLQWELLGYGNLMANNPHNIDPHHGIGGFSLEGSYLNGYGVTFQLGLPPQKNVLKGPPAKV